MPKQNRLIPIQRLAEQEATERSREVSDRLFQLQTEEQRLEQLQTYLREYAENTGGPHSVDINVSTIQSRQNFYRQLTECVAHQQDLVDSLCTQLEHYMDQWNDARTRSMAYQKFADRLEDERGDEVARRDQALLDEVGQQQFLRQV